MESPAVIAAHLNRAGVHVQALFRHLVVDHGHDHTGRRLLEELAHIYRFVDEHEFRVSIRHFGQSADLE